MSKELNEVIIGCMLGDLTAEKPNERSNTRLQFKQSTKNKPYINHLWELFKDYCNQPPITLSRFDERPNRNKEYSAIKFQTASIPCFNKYRNIFYLSNGIKIVPKNIQDLLTPRGLAYWIMDDGYKWRGNVAICTESYTEEENDILVSVLQNKFGLNAYKFKHTNGYRINITSQSILLLLVKPFLLEHFYYKFSQLDNFELE